MHSIVSYFLDLMTSQHFFTYWKQKLGTLEVQSLRSNNSVFQSLKYVKSRNCPFTIRCENTVVRMIVKVTRFLRTRCAVLTYQLEATTLLKQERTKTCEQKNITACFGHTENYDHLKSSHISITIFYYALLQHYCVCWTPNNERTRAHARYTLRIHNLPVQWADYGLYTVYTTTSNQQLCRSRVSYQTMRTGM